MNDVIDNFVSAYKKGALDNYQVKMDPAQRSNMNNYFNHVEDLEQVPQIQQKSTQPSSTNSSFSS
jgi:hypothetical protein